MSTHWLLLDKVVYGNTLTLVGARSLLLASGACGHGPSTADPSAAEHAGAGKPSNVGGESSRGGAGDVQGSSGSTLGGSLSERQRRRHCCRGSVVVESFQLTTP